MFAPSSEDYGILSKIVLSILPGRRVRQSGIPECENCPSRLEKLKFRTHKLSALLRNCAEYEGNEA